MRSLKNPPPERLAERRSDNRTSAHPQNPFRRSAPPREPVSSSFEISRPYVERLLSFDASERSTALGMLAFLFGLAGYALSLWGVISAEPIALRILASLATGIFIAVLFVVGHDACHGALTPHAALNKWIGRLAFLPSLHPFSAWVYSHNVLHHGWTNLKGRDPVYAPLSMDEYLTLSRRRRWLERLHRSVAGVGLLYFNTIWVPLEAFPSAEKRKQIARYGDFQFDRALVLAFFSILLCLVFVFSRSVGEVLLNILLAVLAPFAIWNWLIGFVTFLHHTHPAIVWKDKQEDWTFADAQIRGAAHAAFPEPLDGLFLRIMHHTAHHAIPGIPFYHLRSRQALLDAYTTSYRLSWREVRAVFSICQLYDYRARQWLPFPERGTVAGLNEDTSQVAGDDAPGSKKAVGY